MYIRFKELYRTNVSDRNRQAFGVDAVHRVYMVTTPDGDQQYKYYLVKLLPTTPGHWHKDISNENYEMEYGDIVLYKAPDCPVFTLQEETQRDEDDESLRAYGYGWLSNEEVEEIEATSNADFKFLLMK